MAWNQNTPARRRRREELSAQHPSEAMSAWLDDNERSLQILFRVQREDSPEFRVHSVLRGREDSQVDNARAQSSHKDKVAKIAIARHQYTILVLGNPQKLLIAGARKPDLCYRHSIVAQPTEESGRGTIHVLIQQEPHAGTALRSMSSAATSAMAYRMQAWMSSTVRSG